MTRHRTDEFSMGSDSGMPDERPSHRVYVSGFFLDRAEVSRGAYNLFLESRGKTVSHPLSSPNLPVTGVSWTDADAYCRCQGKRLPTEAE